ncbi:hypothetical protein ACTA71_006310 [Dictyostelium dimigraforme]
MKEPYYTLFDKLKIKHEINFNINDNLFTAILTFLELKFESEPNPTESVAKDDVSRKAINHLRGIDFKNQNDSKGLKSILRLCILITTLVMIIRLFVFNNGDHLWVLKQLFILAISFFFFYPFLFFYNHQIGVCIGTRVIVRQNSTYENRLYKRIFLNKGDLLLVDPDDLAPPLNLNNKVIPSLLSRDIILRKEGNKQEFPTYILQKDTVIGISTFSSTYYIDIITNERDGLLKRYVEKNVQESFFKEITEPIQYTVFSKKGYLIQLEMNTEKLNLSIWGWYYAALSINFGFIKYRLDDFFTKKSIEVDDHNNGFNNFQDITNYKINL